MGAIVGVRVGTGSFHHIRLVILEGCLPDPYAFRWTVDVPDFEFWDRKRGQLPVLATRAGYLTHPF